MAGAKQARGEEGRGGGEKRERERERKFLSLSP